MGTKILADIHKDLKLLITSVSGFEEGEEGFQICERFALSQIKHHRYLSVNSHAVKDEIEKLTQKFLIHGKYDVAKEFQELVQTFLTSFDYERHPQYDIQWSLLSFLLNLATETNKSELSNKDQSINATLSIDENDTEEIDWAQYLKEGEQEFFCNYKSDSSSESDWSEEENDTKDTKLNLSLSKQRKESHCDIESQSLSTVTDVRDSLDQFSSSLPQEIVSKNWLKSNIQNSWWNELDWHQCKVDSQFETAHFYEIWRKNTLKSNKIIGTISEYQVCRELLWMFHGLSSMALFQEERNDQFCIRNASIPSLSNVSFKSILKSFCEYLKIFKELEDFVNKLFKFNNASITQQKPPMTYEVYAVALQKELLHMKRKFVDFEIELMKQETHNTLLTISRDLKMCLDKLKIIYEIHKTVTIDWEKSYNWQSASMLITNLYIKIQNSSNCEKINLCASLYIASMSVYLNIIDVWLSEGRFEDWRDEFIICKCTDTTEVSMEDKALEGFSVRDLSPMCLKNSIMKILLQKVLQMGRSIELLVKLDRISDLWDIMDQEKVTKKTLNEEFLKEIFSECSKYSPTSFSDHTDAISLNITELSVPQTFDTDVEINILQQVATTNNPFLINALECFVAPESSSDDVDGESSRAIEAQSGSHCFEFLDKSEVVLPWKKIFENAITRVLESKFSKASKLVKDILIKEYKLENQLKLMRSVYMMETSHIMNKFCSLLFTEIESNGLWNNSYFVTCSLEEILSQEWPDWSSRWSVTVTNTRSTKVLEAVDNLKLHYAAGWPINMLLTEEALEKYNKIFQFELKLKWALYTLNNLRFADLESDATALTDVVQHFHVRRLESMRFWLMHAVGSIHAYLSGQVLQSLGNILEKALSQAENLEAIITIHNEYLSNVTEHCLQDKKFDDLTGPIYELLKMCDEVRIRWKPDTLAFIGKALDQLENDYVKYHTYLALGLHNAVQHQDADYLTGLSSAFNCSMPAVPTCT